MTILRRTGRSVTVAMAAAGLVLAVANSPSATAVKPGQVATAAETTNGTPAYRVNQSLTSEVPSATAEPPYRQLWTRALGTVVSSPIAIGDRVFAVVNASAADAPGPDMRLVGVDARTGKDLWPSQELTKQPFAAATYGGGLLYTITQDGQLSAWNPTTGARVWQTSLNAQDSYWWQFPPTWSNGVLYTQAGYAGVAIAVRASDGQVLWRAQTHNVGFTPVAVDSHGVWVVYDDMTYELLAPADGHVIRSYTTEYSGSSGNPPVLAQGYLWMRGDYPLEQVTAVSESTGKTLRSFPATSTPAFDAEHVYVSSDGTLKALDAKTFATRWTYVSSVGVADVRLIADGYVYVEDGDGMLRALAADTGRTVWSVRFAPAPGPGGTAYPEMDSRGFTVPGIGTANGRLLVPASGGRLVAYVPAGA